MECRHVYCHVSWGRLDATWAALRRLRSYYLTHSWGLDWWVPGRVHTPVGHDHCTSGAPTCSEIPNRFCLEPQGIQFLWATKRGGIEASGMQLVILFNLVLIVDVSEFKLPDEARQNNLPPKCGELIDGGVTSMVWSLLLYEVIILYMLRVNSTCHFASKVGICR
jgi:hypothetical protein